MPAMTVLATAGPEAAPAFIELGAVALVLAALARLAGRLGVTTIPFYLLAGLAVGKGGLAPLDVSAEFIRLVAEIGVLLLLFNIDFHGSVTMFWLFLGLSLASARLAKDSTLSVS